MKRLTKRLLEAIIYMGGCIEADGYTNIQGCETDSERNAMFNACCDAMVWASQELRRREQAKKKQTKGQ